jgi:type IV secretory pathway TrbF-like protein
MKFTVCARSLAATRDMEGSVYLKARQEWDARYADLVLGKRNWQITAADMMAITLVLAFGMVWGQHA